MKTTGLRQSSNVSRAKPNAIANAQAKYRDEYANGPTTAAQQASRDVTYGANTQTTKRQEDNAKALGVNLKAIAGAAERDRQKTRLNARTRWPGEQVPRTITKDWLNKKRKRNGEDPI